MRCFLSVVVVGVMVETCLAADPAANGVSGNAVIRGRFGASEIVITTTDRLAGAIHSVTWDGREFIDSHDHGRQLQAACSFDCGLPGEFWAERFNPTEAGSRRDGAGESSSSKLLSLEGSDAELSTVVRPAFWLAPGEASSQRPALNDTVLSNHRIAKRVRIGHGELANAIVFDVAFTVPPDERHTFAQFEALTGYMPPEFGTFLKFNPAVQDFEPLDDGPGEQAFPVVLADATGKHAMGVYSPDQPSPGFEQAGYGRFRFVEQKVVKWNCVFRTRNAAGIPAGEYRFRVFVALGTKEDVRRTLSALMAECGRGN